MFSFNKGANITSYKLRGSQQYVVETRRKGLNPPAINLRSKNSTSTIYGAFFNMLPLMHGGFIFYSFFVKKRIKDESTVHEGKHIEESESLNHKKRLATRIKLGGRRSKTPPRILTFGPLI